jgi:hypothetical protein
MALSNLPGPWVWHRRNGAFWRIQPQLHIHDGPHRIPPPLEPAVGLLDQDTKVLHRCSQVHLVGACGIEPAVATVGPLGLLHLKSKQLCPDCWPVPSGALLHQWGLK